MLCFFYFLFLFFKRPFLTFCPFCLFFFILVSLDDSDDAGTDGVARIWSLGHSLGSDGGVSDSVSREYPPLRWRTVSAHHNLFWEILAIDCYYPVAAEAVFLIVGLKNIISFGFSYSVVPWVTAWGFKKAYGTLAAVTFGAILLWVPLFIFGKMLRFASAKWKVIMWW